MTTRIKFISKRSVQLVTLALVAFFIYIMGVIWLLDPHTHQTALRVIPAALLASTLILLFFSQAPYTPRKILVFAAIVIIGYLLEVIGVKTGLIFGQYTYGSGLGYKLYDTPLIIGINWLFVTYAAACTATLLTRSNGLQWVYTVLIMLLYDVFLEMAAPKMDLWHWEGEVIPLQNYVVWGIAALFFLWLIRKNRIVTVNVMALPFLMMQTFMFIVVAAYTPQG